MAVQASSAVQCCASSASVMGLFTPQFPARSFVFLQSLIQSRSPQPGPNFLFPDVLAVLAGPATGCTLSLEETERLEGLIAVETAVEVADAVAVLVDKLQLERFRTILFLGVTGQWNDAANSILIGL